MLDSVERAECQPFFLRRNERSEMLPFGALFLHGLGRQLRRQDAKALLDGHTVSGELVVGGETGGMSRLGDDAFDRLFLERVDSLAILPSNRYKASFVKSVSVDGWVPSSSQESSRGFLPCLL